MTVMGGVIWSVYCALDFFTHDLQIIKNPIPNIINFSSSYVSSKYSTSPSSTSCTISRLLLE